MIVLSIVYFSELPGGNGIASILFVVRVLSLFEIK